MRIGLIAPPWVPVPPTGYGGIEAVIDRLARGLLRAGHDVLLAAPGNSTCPSRAYLVLRTSQRPRFPPESGD
jgi:hypothetical protein